jgi:hypothetical protein
MTELIFETLIFAQSYGPTKELHPLLKLPFERDQKLLPLHEVYSNFRGSHCKGLRDILSKLMGGLYLP